MTNVPYLLNAVLAPKHKKMTTLATWVLVAGILNTPIRRIVQLKENMHNIATREEPAYMPQQHHL